MTFLELTLFSQCLKFIFILLKYNNIQQNIMLLFVSSLIPRQPLGGGMDATQSASRGSLVVQCWPDYKVANRLVWFGTELPSKFLRQHAHLSSNNKGKSKKKLKPLYPSQATYFRSLSRDIFHWPEGNHLFPFIQGGKSPYLAQTFTADFLSVVCTKTVYFSFPPLYIDIKVN